MTAYLNGRVSELRTLLETTPVDRRSADPEREWFFDCPVCGSEARYVLATDQLSCARDCSRQRVAAALTSRHEIAVGQARGEGDYAGRAAFVPTLPPDLERCAQHGLNWVFGCAYCLVSRAQVERYGRARAAVRDAAEDGSSFAETSLVVEDKPPMEFLDLGDGRKVVRPGDIVLLHALKAAGKSPALVLAAQDHVRAGALWTLLDYELGPVLMRERLMSAGWTQELMNEAIYYVWQPQLLTEEGKECLLKGMLDKADRTGRTPSLLTWDTYSRSVSRMPGADPEKNQHVNEWFTSHVDWARVEIAKASGVPLTQYVTDHTNKDDAITPGGGHAKQDRVLINLWLRTDSAFAQTHEKGSSKLIVAKHTHGDYPIGTMLADLRNRIEDDRSSFYWDPSPPGSGESSDHVEIGLDKVPPYLAAEMEVMEKLEQAGTGGAMTTQVCGESGGGDYTRLRKALTRLDKEGKVVSRADGRGGRGERWWRAEHLPG